MTESLPGIAEVEAAQRRLAGVAVRTPLLEPPVLAERLGARVFLKPETLQRTGSFKFRGAYNAIKRLAETGDESGKPRRVVAYSSGNHAQGVAAAAKLLDFAASIVMPADAPALKIARTRGHGAEVLLYDRYREEREAVAQRLVEETGASLIKPYDAPDVIAGQGTCGLEIAEDLAAQGLSPDSVLICCGGGGLSAGIGLALADRCPAARLYSVEPADFDDTRRSLAAGRRLENAPGGRSICDALLAKSPGALTFPLNRRNLAGGLAVTEEEVRAAMRFAYAELKLVVEPGGAVALAALLAGKLADPGKVVVAVLSGGNVDPGPYAEILAA